MILETKHKRNLQITVSNLTIKSLIYNNYRWAKWKVTPYKFDPADEGFEYGKLGELFEACARIQHDWVIWKESEQSARCSQPG